MSSHKKQEGVSVLLVVFIIVAITFLGLIFVSLLTTGSEVASREVDSLEAIYVAEGAMEATISSLRQAPPATFWVWNDGYLARALGAGTADVEVLQYEHDDTDDVDALNPDCIDFVSTIVSTGANPARTIYVTLYWETTDDLDIALFDDDTCGAGAGVEITATATVTKTNTETIRYRMQNADGDYHWSVEVSNNDTGPSDYTLSISHPDDTETVLTAAQFTAASWRSIISEGTVNDAVREVFAAIERNP